MKTGMKDIREILREAAESIHASLAETDISDSRREYRKDLERRLRYQRDLIADEPRPVFLILWHGVNEWEVTEGDLAQAHKAARMDRRHLNYGRKGYSLIQCNNPVALMDAPEDVENPSQDLTEVKCRAYGPVKSPTVSEALETNRVVVMRLLSALKHGVIFGFLAAAIAAALGMIVHLAWSGYSWDSIRVTAIGTGIGNIFIQGWIRFSSHNV